jgi:hypothetical protein
MSNQTSPRDPNRVPSLIGVDNISFTETTTVAVDPATHQMLTQTVITETTPPNPSKLNASYVLSYNASGELVKIEKTIGSTTYTKTSVPLSGDTTITGTKTFSTWT